MTFGGDLSDWAAAEQTALKGTLAAELGCLQPNCTMECRFSAGSVFVESIMTIPDGEGTAAAATSAAAVAAVWEASAALARCPACLDLRLSISFRGVSLEAVAAPALTAGVVVPVAMAMAAVAPPPTVAPGTAVPPLSASLTGASWALTTDNAFLVAALGGASLGLLLLLVGYKVYERRQRQAQPTDSTAKLPYASGVGLIDSIGVPSGKVSDVEDEHMGVQHTPTVEEVIDFAAEQAVSAELRQDRERIATLRDERERELRTAALDLLARAISPHADDGEEGDYESDDEGGKLHNADRAGVGANIEHAPEGGSATAGEDEGSLDNFVDVHDGDVAELAPRQPPHTFAGQRASVPALGADHERLEELREQRALRLRMAGITLDGVQEQRAQRVSMEGISPACVVTGMNGRQHKVEQPCNRSMSFASNMTARDEAYLRAGVSARQFVPRQARATVAPGASLVRPESAYERVRRLRSSSTMKV